jgi:hypothetical protein
VLFVIALIALPTTVDAASQHWDYACKATGAGSSDVTINVIPATPRPAPSILDFLSAPPGQFTLLASPHRATRDFGEFCMLQYGRRTP